MQLEFPVSTSANPYGAVPCEIPILSGSGEGQHCEDLRSTRWMGSGPGSNWPVVPPVCQRACCVSHTTMVALCNTRAVWHAQDFLLDKSRHPFHFIYGEWRREEEGKTGPNGEEGAD